MACGGCTCPNALGRGKNDEAESGHTGRPGDNAPVGGERGLQRHGHHPRDEPRAETAGEPRTIGDESGEIRRRGEMRGGEFAGPRQKDGDGDRRQQPEEGGRRKQRRLAADHEIDGKDAKRDEAAEQMRGDKGLVTGGRQRVAAGGIVHERAEIG